MSGRRGALRWLAPYPDQAMTELDTLRTAIADAGVLGTAILLGLRASPPWEVVDSIAQDEYTIDVIMSRGGPDGPVLVLDCT
jgi:hypothetical protein